MLSLFNLLTEHTKLSIIWISLLPVVKAFSVTPCLASPFYSGFNGFHSRPDSLSRTPKTELQFYVTSSVSASFFNQCLYHRIHRKTNENWISMFPSLACILYLSIHHNFLPIITYFHFYLSNISIDTLQVRVVSGLSADLLSKDLIFSGLQVKTYRERVSRLVTSPCQVSITLRWL